MITFDKTDKKLIVPSSLGNFGNAGGGSGSGMTPAEVQEMIDESISAYDTEVQVDLEDIRENVSGNTEDIEELSGATVALKEQVDNISLSGITGDVTALSAATVSLSEDLSELSGATNDIRSDINDLSGTTENILSDIETLSGSTSDNAADIAELSGATESVSAVAQDAYDAIFYEEEGETYSQIDDLWSALEDKQDALDAGEGIAINDNQISVNTGDSLGFDPDGHLQVEIGAGMDRDEDDALTLKIGVGLGFSGDTLVVSGISGGDGNYLIVDSLAEIADPYEGLEAYVREHSENLVYSGYNIDASQVEENYVAHIYFNGQDDMPVYRSGGEFYWDWDNNAEGALREREDFFYTINGDQTVFSVFLHNPDARVEFEQDVTTAVTATTVTILHKGATYRYDGTAWEEYQPAKTYYLSEMSQAELVALYNEITRFKEMTFPAGNYRFFITNVGNDEYQGRFEVFVARFYGSTNVSFSGVMQSRYNNTLLQRGYELSSEGEFSATFEQNSSIPEPSYDAFVVAEYDNDKCLTGMTHNTKATLWEGYKGEGEGYVRKTLVAYVHTADNMPARFNLIYVDGDPYSDEDNAALYFGCIYNSIGDSSLHSVRFRLTKDTANDVYTVDNIAEYSYSRTS